MARTKTSAEVVSVDYLDRIITVKVAHDSDASYRRSVFPAGYKAAVQAASTTDWLAQGYRFITKTGFTPSGEGSSLITYQVTAN